jgi:signal-transduction protein with cAMP-binding, CBS, and nucleotidyltransferase domain
VQATLKDLLARSELFAGLAPNELEAIARACEQRDFDRDETIFTMQESADGLYVIATGRVKVCVSSSGGRADPGDARAGTVLRRDGGSTTRRAQPP